jgi:hypothetical protein
MRKRDVAARFEELLGGHGTRTRLAKALGYRREHIGKILNGDEPAPEHLLAVLELLEKVPEDEWPQRWRK